MNRLILLAGLSCLLAVSRPGIAQAVERQEAELVEENADVRVVRLNSPSGEAEKVSTSGHDAVIVALDDTELTGSMPKIETLKRGEARFLPRESKYSAKGTTILVELKRHWERPVKYCEAPANCTRETIMSGVVVSSTTTIFTNGFVTAMRYKVAPNGSLDASFYSAKGKDSVVFIALTPVHVHFGGTEEQLETRQAYVTNESALSVDAGDKEVEWVVVRLNQPR